MSLIDSDKDSQTRSNPTINADDNVHNRMSHKTLGTTYKTAGNPDTNRLIFDKSSVKGFDGSNDNNIFIGYDPALSPRPIIRIADEGFDQSTADDSQLIFNSERNLFKIVLSGNSTATVPTPFLAGTTVTATIPHGLTIKPGFLAFVDIPLGDGSTIIQGKLNTVPCSAVVKSGVSSGLTSVQVSADVDTTNLYLRVTNTFGANLVGLDGSWVFRYYVLQETAN